MPGPDDEKRAQEALMRRPEVRDMLDRMYGSAFEGVENAGFTSAMHEAIRVTEAERMADRPEWNAAIDAVVRRLRALVPPNTSHG